MNSEQFSKWLTLVANIGVIFGLILVAYELQQNSELMRIQINQARADSAMVSNEHSFNSPFLPPILIKIKNGESLDDEEWIRYVDYFRAMNRNQDNVLSQYRAGMLGENTPRSIADYGRVFVGSTEVSRRAWQTTKHGYTDEYVEFIEAVIDQVSQPD